MRRVVTLILAGGKGTRLEPLTRDRAKPAVPFGGAYRIIDFALSNCLNSGLRRILVMTQYKGASLDRHLNMGWRFLTRELDEYVDVLPPQQRIDERWYEGTADAVYQNIYSIERANPDVLLILSGDHIYKMDYDALIEDHMRSGAVATVGCIPVRREEAKGFGVMDIDAGRRVTKFVEKPAEPPTMPDDPTRSLASMGIYVFDARTLFEELCRDATDRESSRDFGKNIIPSMIGRQKVRAYPFTDRSTGGPGYWRDVGTLDAYYEASMDLVSVTPELNLYERDWEIRSYQPNFPPAKFVFAADDRGEPRVGQALDSIVCPGSIVSGGKVERSVISYDVRVNSWASVEDSILFEGVDVGRNARLRNVIVDKGVSIPAGTEIGFDHAADRARGLTVSSGGVTVIGKTDTFEPVPEQSPVHEIPAPHLSDVAARAKRGSIEVEIE
ncbi:MAG: glucose-1-phosphate adenylyltransferase [Planctomycetota bacterium]